MSSSSTANIQRRELPGWNQALSHKIDTSENLADIEKVAKLVAEIQKYYRDETTKEENPSKRTGQIRPEVTYRESPDTAQQETDQNGSGGIPSQAEGSRSGINQFDNGEVRVSIGDGSPKDAEIALTKATLRHPTL